ncbi:hypothetical protein Dimus_016198 [Dionaea muscipula]
MMSKYVNVHKDYGQHVNGECSMAVIQANNLLEDYSRFESGPMSSLEAGPHGTFIGIYDGHRGPEAAQFVDNHLFENLKSMYTMSLISECIYLSDSKNSSNFKFAE